MTDTDRMHFNGDAAVTPTERRIAARCDELKRQRDHYRRELKKARVYLMALCLWLFLWSIMYAAPFDWAWLAHLQQLRADSSLIGLGAAALLVVIASALWLTPPRKEWE